MTAIKPQPQPISFLHGPFADNYGSKAHEETALLLDALTVTPETLAAIPEYACPCCGALHAGGGTKTTVRCPCGLTIHFRCRHELIATIALVRRFWPSGWCGKCHEVVHTFESSRRYPNVGSATSYDDMIRQLNAADERPEPVSDQKETP